MGNPCGSGCGVDAPVCGNDGHNTLAHSRLGDDYYTGLCSELRPNHPPCYKCVARLTQPYPYSLRGSPTWKIDEVEGMKLSEGNSREHPLKLPSGTEPSTVGDPSFSTPA